ncbi:hypothetical protein PAXRUDRAFT_480927 [Paxillus rubicundulus Ve08.2h10]|uniref:Uncharacterized protein n=1 Tax=Paxillus rubicundulus Ve08.2h10 TaxID=930991 RepID=A0A0D0E7H7_9AGAM|nr:hypothetical protein PAXRUDRAFT_480927 [Paxillus rubicundulus Ve08.2h10]
MGIDIITQKWHGPNLLENNLVVSRLGHFHGNRLCFQCTGCVFTVDLCIIYNML